MSMHLIVQHVKNVSATVILITATKKLVFVLVARVTHKVTIATNVWLVTMVMR